MLQRKYILTSLTGHLQADLICCTNLDFEFMRDTLRLYGQGFEIIPELDAIKLLLAGQVLPFGCYRITGDPKKDDEAALKAKLLYLGLSNEFGVVSDVIPEGLSVAMLPKISV